MVGNAGWVNWEGYLVIKLGASKEYDIRGVLLLGRANEHGE